MHRARLPLFTLALGLTASAPRLLAASHTWSGATSGLWSDASNWSVGGAPANGESNVVLVFPAGQGNMGAMTNDVTGLNVTSIAFSDPAYSAGGNAIGLNGTISLDGAAPTGILGFSLPIALTGNSVFSVRSGLGLNLLGVLSGGFDVTVQSTSGPNGTVVFSAANTYTKKTSIDSGFVLLSNAAGLGTADSTAATGTTVASGATLALLGVAVFDEALSIGGTGTDGTGALRSVGGTQASWVNGPITLTADALLLAQTNRLNVYAAISLGPFGVTTRAQDPFVVSLGGAGGAQTGPTVVEFGTCELAAGIFPDSPVVLNGTLGTGSTLRSVSSNVSTISLGPGSLPKRFEPGTGTSTGSTTSKGVNLSGTNGHFAVKLNGTTPGTQHDRVIVNGPVTVTGAALDVTIGYVPSLGHGFTIVDNDGADPVVGTFLGKPEGATFVAGGRTLQITYVGGTGNDVVLTVTSLTPAELTGFTAD